MTHRGREVRGGVPARIASVDGSSHEKAFPPPFLVVAPRVHRVPLSPQEPPRRRLPVLLRGDVQRHAPVPIRRVRPRAAREQRLDDVHVAARGGDVERGLAVGVPRVHRGEHLVHQKSNRRRLAGDRGEVRRGGPPRDPEICFFAARSRGGAKTRRVVGVRRKRPVVVLLESAEEAREAPLRANALEFAKRRRAAQRRVRVRARHAPAARATRVQREARGVALEPVLVAPARAGFFGPRRVGPSVVGPRFVGPR